MVFGLAQPVLGLRMLLSDRTLLVESLQPALLLAGFCAMAATLGLPIGSSSDDLEESFIHRFFSIFAVLAPLPSILLASHYANLAAVAHQRLQLGTCQPRKVTLLRAARHALQQAVAVAFAVAPILGVLGSLPLVGKALAASVGAGWALHWVVVEAFDSARVQQTGSQTESQTESQNTDSVPEIWFVRMLFHASQRLPIGGFLLRYFARFCRFLARPWKEEIALTEQHQSLVFGFALATAALLATPVLNLLFRPIIVIASVHLLARLPQASPTETEPANTTQHAIQRDTTEPL